MEVLPYPELNPLPQRIIRKPLPPFLKEIAKDQSKEDPNRVDEEIRKFRSAVMDLKIPCRLDDMYLLAFLRVRKYNHQAALRSFKNCNRVWTKYRKHLKSDDLNFYKTLFAENMFLALKRRDHLGRCIILCIAENWDIKKYDCLDVVLQPFMAGLQLLETDEFQLNGVTVIVDLKGVTFTHVRKFLPLGFDLVFTLQDSMPIKLKGLHLVNQGPLIDYPLKFIWPFFTEKFKQRVMLHGKDISSLHEQIPAEYLPAEYGGKVPLKNMGLIDFAEKLPHFPFL